MISVLIPTYKRTPDVHRCLQALLEQSRPPDEILVVVRDTDTETRNMLDRHYKGLSFLKTVCITAPGVVAALNAGLEQASGDIIAITDDDTAPRRDWLLRIEKRFESDPHLGGLGGRDWVHQNGRTEDGVKKRVGKVQWFGRVVGNHHLGGGPAREVDVLKGANMSYRRQAIGSIRFDPNLKGSGAQVYNDMDFSMMVQKAGWKLLYDPEVAVDHYPAPRHDEDQRNSFNSQALLNMVHNETAVMLKYLESWQRIPYLLWAVTVGMASSPGLVQWLRLLLTRRAAANLKLAVTMRGRWEGLRTWRRLERGDGIMKVGIVMPLADMRGGAEIMLLHLLQANRQSGGVQYSVVFFEDGPLVKETEALGYPVRVIHAGKLRQAGRYAKTVFALAAWLRREKIETVMSWMSKAHLYAGPAAVLARTKAVWYQHGIPTIDKMERVLALLPAKAVMVPSHAALKAQKRISPKLEAVVVHPSVDLKAYNPKALPSVREARAKLGLPLDATIVGIVARLQRWKGVHHFVEAASQVGREFPDAAFVVVGGAHPSEPDYPKELERQAEEAGLTDRIRFAGHQTNAAEWVQAFDIFVHASVQEPFGMVIIEGMALAKAVIASAAGGPLEIISSGENGILVTPENPPELAEAIKKLIREPAFYKKISEAGRRRAEAFSAERLAAEVTELLGSLSAQGSGGSRIEYKHP